MTNYPFYKRFILAFYSKDLYAFVGRSEKNKSGFLYLFIMILLLWIPMMVKMQLQISNSIANDLPSFVEKLPVVTIKNGLASFDKPSPYIIRDDATGKDMFIFDTSGKYTSLAGTDAQFLLTGTHVVYIENKMQTKEYSLSKIDDFTLTHEKIYSWAAIGNFLCIFLYIVIVPAILAYRSFQALIYALIGLIIQSILQTQYPFQTIYRLTILAITPAFVLSKILDLFGIDFTGWWLLCIVISIAYLYFGLKATKEADDAAALSSAEFGTDYGSGNSGIQ
ncbi:MAG: hypothetical protein JWP12_2578 [Bacteroidetes bacterium]|nr:hypothetical protein [Bacteroidota bacterium]